MAKVILSMPPTTNHTYLHKGRMVFKTKQARDWENDALLAIQEQKLKPLNPGSVSVLMVMYLKFPRDIESCCKIVLDVFAKAGIYENDKYVTELILRKEFDKENPRIEVELQNIS